MADEFDLAVTTSPFLSTGARWDLQPEIFARWWQCLPMEDREEFLGIHGGDNTLARFVCAFEYLTTSQGAAPSGSAIITAYAIAAKLEPDANDTKIRASKAWRHDAVQQLLDRLRYRGMRQASTRITNSVGFLIEKMVTRSLDPMQASVLDQAAAVKAALAFTKIVADEEALERKERNKRGFVQLADGKKPEIETPTPDKAALYLKVLQQQLGPAVFAKVLEEAKKEDAS
jgi:hypothetical protein